MKKWSAEGDGPGQISDLVPFMANKGGGAWKCPVGCWGLTRKTMKRKRGRERILFPFWSFFKLASRICNKGNRDEVQSFTPFWTTWFEMLVLFCQTSDLIAPTIRLQVPKLLCVSHEVAAWPGTYLWGPMKKARTLNLSLSTLVTRFPWVLLGVNLMVTKIYLDVNRVIDELYGFVKYLTYPAQLYNFGWLHIILVQWRCWISCQDKRQQTYGIFLASASYVLN